MYLRAVGRVSSTEEALMLLATRVVFQANEPDDLFETTTSLTRTGADAGRRVFTAIMNHKGHVVTRLDYISS